MVYTLNSWDGIRKTTGLCASDLPRVMTSGSCGGHARHGGVSREHLWGHTDADIYPMVQSRGNMVGVSPVALFLILFLMLAAILLAYARARRRKPNRTPQEAGTSPAPPASLGYTPRTDDGFLPPGVGYTGFGPLPDLACGSQGAPESARIIPGEGGRGTGDPVVRGISMGGLDGSGPEEEYTPGGFVDRPFLTEGDRNLDRGRKWGQDGGQDLDPDSDPDDRQNQTPDSERDGQGGSIRDASPQRAGDTDPGAGVDRGNPAGKGEPGGLAWVSGADGTGGGYLAPEPGMGDPGTWADMAGPAPDHPMAVDPHILDPVTGAHRPSGISPPPPELIHPHLPDPEDLFRSPLLTRTPGPARETVPWIRAPGEGASASTGTGTGTGTKVRIPVMGSDHGSVSGAPQAGMPVPGGAAVAGGGAFVPVSADPIHQGKWTCPSCGHLPELQYMYCTECGHRR